MDRARLEISRTIKNRRKKKKLHWCYDEPQLIDKNKRNRVSILHSILNAFNPSSSLSIIEPLSYGRHGFIVCPIVIIIIIIILLIWDHDRISIEVDYSCDNEPWSFRPMALARAERYFVSFAIDATAWLASDTLEFYSNEATSSARIRFMMSASARRNQW